MKPPTMTKIKTTLEEDQFENRRDTNRLKLQKDIFLSALSGLAQNYGDYSVMTKRAIQIAIYASDAYIKEVYIEPDYSNDMP